MIGLLILATLAAQDCPTPPGAPALDHVIIATGNLDSSTAVFRQRGFTIKPGRLHTNNLLNNHIKFRDGTEIELMTLRGLPTDAMSRDYQRLIGDGDGGVYVALRINGISAARAAATALGIATISSTSGGWSFLSFPYEAPTAALFFSEGTVTVQDPESTFVHRPPVTSMLAAWVEGGDVLGALLSLTGAVRCGTATAPDGRIGQRYALSKGEIVVLPSTVGVRPRVLGVELQTTAPTEALATPSPRFWIRWRPRKEGSRDQ